MPGFWYSEITSSVTKNRVPKASELKWNRKPQNSLICHTYKMEWHMFTRIFHFFMLAYTLTQTLIYYFSILINSTFQVALGLICNDQETIWLSDIFPQNKDMAILSWTIYNTIYYATKLMALRTNMIYVYPICHGISCLYTSAPQRIQ